MGVIDRLVSPKVITGIFLVWAAAIFALGIIVSVSGSGEPEYFNAVDNSYTISLVAACFSFFADEHFRKRGAVAAIALNAAAFILSVGGSRVAIAEMTSCRKLYNDDIAYGQLSEAKMNQYFTGSSTLSVSTLSRILNAHDISTYGVKCMGIQFTENTEYYAHVVCLVFYCLVTSVCSVAFVVIFLLHFKPIRAYAERIENVWNTLEQMAAEKFGEFTKKHGSHHHGKQQDAKMQ